MAIESLRIADFRNLTTAVLTPCSQGLNIIHGQNGSGKTSLLEAIHFIGTGKSFRHASSQRLIRHEADQFNLFAHILSDSQRQIPIGMERASTGTTRIRVAEKETITMAELAAVLPLRVMDSQSHNLLEAGPVFRRKYLDWGLFYQFEGFLTVWRQFERVLKQRNSLLKERRLKLELDSWTEELVKYGLELTDYRRQYVKRLLPYLSEASQRLLGMPDLQVCYHPGWNEEEDYAAALAGDYLNEYRFGHTQLGPHRADLDIFIDTIPVKHFLSRGQQKLLVCAMILAQGMLLAEQGNKRVIYLVDDLPSELDKPGRERLLSVLAEQQTQIFITAIEKETICDLVIDKPVKVFHVEHGCVRQI